MRLLLRREERRPDPEPLDHDDRRPVLVVMVLWVVALGVTLLSQDALRAADREWWVWSCVAGLALGAAGLVHLQHRRSRGRR